MTNADILVADAPVDRVRTGDEVVFRLHFETAEPVPNPVFVLTLASLSGVTVTTPTSRDGGAVPVTVDGRGHVDITIRDLPLLPGPHVVHTEVTGWGGKHVYDHVQNARSFDVLAGDSSEIGGVVTLRPSWNWTGDGVSDDRYS